MRPELKNESLKKWQLRIHEIIFEADTPEGKAFDLLLLWSIILSVVVVMLDSVKDFRDEYGAVLHVMEWFFTLLFTIEYVLRLISVGRPLRYAASFYGVVDLLSILPTYLSLIFPGTHYLALQLLEGFVPRDQIRVVSSGGKITRFRYVHYSYINRGCQGYWQGNS